MITSLPVTTLVIVALSIVVAVSVYYGLTGSSSARGRKRRTRRRKDGRSAAEQDRKTDAERNSRDEMQISRPTTMHSERGAILIRSRKGGL